jgi:hypothetical protein
MLLVGERSIDTAWIAHKHRHVALIIVVCIMALTPRHQRQQGVQQRGPEYRRHGIVMVQQSPNQPPVGAGFFTWYLQPTVRKEQKLCVLLFNDS